MLKYIKLFILKYLHKKGFQKKISSNDGTILLYQQMNVIFQPKNNEIISVVFSKDRAMQLDCFLASYFENVENPSPIKVLYYASNDSHNKSYIDLINLYAKYPVGFIMETDFKLNLITLLENTNQDKIIFFVDDMIFTHKINYNLIKDIDPLKNILCLSRGKDLKYSIVLEKKIKTPDFSIFPGDLFHFFWNEINEFSEWTYPIGVSGYMFSRLEIIALIKAIQFKAPNSLENNLQAFIPYFNYRGGLCFEKVIAPCVHTNLTQTEGHNNILGHYSLEELLTMWNQNKRINYNEFKGLDVSEAEMKKYNFIDRI